MNNSLFLRALQLVFLVALWLFLCAPAAAATRLAVLEVDSPALAKVATLLEVELLKLPDTEALERAQIGEILKEQKLQAAFAAEATSQRVSLGKILKADVLVFLQAVEKPEPHGNLVAFETKNGLRLNIAAFEMSTNAEHDAKAILPQVKQALERARGEICEIVAVPPLVSTDLAFERQALGKPLATVIEQMFLSRPGVAVVELAEAKSLADETTLAGEKTVSRKLPLYLLGEYRHDGYGADARLTITLSLNRGAKVLGSQTTKNVVPGEAATVVRREAAALFDKVSEAKAPVIASAVEAQQLAERATLMYRLSAWMDCLELAEASLLLKPDQAELHRLAASAGSRQMGQESRAAYEQAEKEKPPFPGTTFVPPPKLVAELQAAHKPLALRILPHFEYYLAHTSLRYSEDTYIKIAGYFGGSGIDEQQREMFVRVLRAKQAAKVQDDTILFLAYCQQSCFQNATAAEKLQWKLDLAEAWPITTTNGNRQSHLESMLLNGIARDDPQLPALLEKLKAIKGPAVQQAAANFQRRLDNNWMLQFDRPMPVIPARPPPLDSIPRDELAEVKFVPINLRGIGTSEIRGWVPASPGLDALWNKNQLFFVGEKPKLVGLEPIPIDTFYSSQACCFDGRYVWAFHSAGKGKPELIVVEPATARQERITVEHGLPPIDLDEISMTALGEGSVCVIGHFDGRAWIGLGAFDGATRKGSLTVIHEARELPTGKKDAAWKNPNTAFPSSWMYTLTAASDGPGAKKQRIFVYRYGTTLPLFIDPVARRLEVAPWNWNVYGLRGVVQHEGAIYWIGNIKDWTNQDWRVHRLGYSSSKPEVYAPQAPPFGMLFPYGNRVGAIGQNVNQSIWIADSWDGKFRELRTDLHDKSSFNSYAHFFQSSHFGAIAVRGTEAYRVELPPAAPATEKDAAAKPAAAAELDPSPANAAAKPDKSRAAGKGNKGAKGMGKK